MVNGIEPKRKLLNKILLKIKIKNVMKTNKLIYKILFVCITFVISQLSLLGSSHREAPLIANDPLADNVDLYAFKSPDNPNMITIIATYVPMQLPHGGPNYFSFGENIRYEIHVDNDASKPGDEVTYRFTFKQTNEDPTTFFNIRLGKQNLKTTYTMERSLDNGKSWTTIITNGIVPPNNIGPRSINSAVGLNTTYDALFNGGITTASSGEKVFAGPTDDPFFVDLGGIFDLGDSPRQVGKNVDGLACMNVSAIAIQVPINVLLKTGAPTTPTNILDGDYVIGVWASASRQAITTLSTNDAPVTSGDWIQVSRLGMPLTNEAVIPIGKKDFWNSITPYDEIAETTMDEYFYNPELALYMDDALFGGAVPAFGQLRIQKNSLGAFNFGNGGDGLFGLKGNAALDGTALDDKVFGTLLLPAKGKPRSVDLWPAFHTGVPNVIPYQLATGKNGNPLAAGKPFVNNFLPNGGDMLRLNMAVPATPRDDPNFSSMGLIQAAAIGLTVAPFNTTANLEFIPNMDGFPNGRRLEDDVTRIELQAVAGAVLAAVGLWYDDYIPGTSASPVTKQLVNVLSFTTGVEKNDRKFTAAFPYLAQPNSGTGECSGAIYKEVVEVKSKNTIFASTNTGKRIGVFSINDNSTITGTSFVSKTGDADGIYYDDKKDILIQLNRGDNRLDAYGNVLANVRNGVPPTFLFSSTSDFSNGREITVAGDRIVVTQDAIAGNNNQNKLLVYKISDAGFKLVSSHDVAINLWGVHADLNTLYAVVDNGNQLAIFENFFANTTASIVPTTTIAIEGLVRTHGLTYDYISDLMVLTDIGDAASATDGAIVIINDFKTKIADKTISTAEQIRVGGANSQLGNPVDVAIDGKIYIAERAGGKLLTFDFPSASGDVTPKLVNAFPGISALYLLGSTREGQPTTATVDIADGSNINISVYPNPVSDVLKVAFDGDVNNFENTLLQVYDITGKLMSSKRLNGNNAQIEISSYNSGSYFLKASNKKYTYQSKFIKM
jgi:SpoU rRNA methylase family enzyme